MKLGIVDCGGDGAGDMGWGRAGAGNGEGEDEGTAWAGAPLGEAGAGRETAAADGGGGACVGAAPACCVPFPGSFTIPWHFGHLSMKGVVGTLASSTMSRLEQFGQLVCTSYLYLSIKLSISLSGSGDSAAAVGPSVSG